MRRADAGSPEPLGVTPERGGANVAVYSAHATAIEICLFDPSEGRERERIALPERTGDVFHGFIPGIAAGDRYGLRARGPWDPRSGHRFNPAKLLVDPYARALDRPFVLHRSMLGANDADATRDDTDSAPFVPKAIVMPSPTPAPARRPRVPWSQTILYELHVRGYTRTHPGVPDALRGTCAGLAHPAAIEHLTRLGITTVELMPIAAAVDERHLADLGLSNYWGYNPAALFVPDPRLAPGGIDELRDCVAALQAAGIEVILDVVLNHTGEGDARGPTLSLRGLDNATYYRTLADDRARYVDDSGCGNTLALDRAPVLRLAMDVLRYYALAAGVDGFRFDLATTLGRRDDGFDPGAPLLQAIAQDPVLRDLKLVAEPWDVGPGGHRLGAFPAPWGEWNDRYRDTVRRYWRGDAGLAGDLATRFAGSADVFAVRSRVPSRSVNFVTAHDGFTLADLVAYAAKHNERNGEGNRDGSDANLSWNHGVEGPTPDAAVRAKRGRDVRNLLATLLLSRGTPMIAMGDELGRTQHGNNNAYAQDNALTWIDWDGADDDLVDFVAALVALRRSHPALRADRWLTGAPADGSGIADVEWRHPEGRAMSDGDWTHPGCRALVAILYAGASSTAGADRVAVALNAGDDPVTARWPDAREGCAWRRRIDTSLPSGRPDAASAATGESGVVSPRSVVVLVEEAGTVIGRRRSGVEPEVLDRLAAAAGIAGDWWDLAGGRHVVGTDTRRALLAAMGLDAGTTGEARDRLVELAEARERRRLACDGGGSRRRSRERGHRGGRRAARTPRRVAAAAGGRYRADAVLHARRPPGERRDGRGWSPAHAADPGVAVAADGFPHAGVRRRCARPMSRRRGAGPLLPAAGNRRRRAPLRPRRASLRAAPARRSGHRGFHDVIAAGRGHGARGRQPRGHQSAARALRRGSGAREPLSPLRPAIPGSDLRRRRAGARSRGLARRALAARARRPRHRKPLRARPRRLRRRLEAQGRSAGRLLRAVRAAFRRRSARRRVRSFRRRWRIAAAAVRDLRGDRRRPSARALAPLARRSAPTRRPGRGRLRRPARAPGALRALPAMARGPSAGRGRQPRAGERPDAGLLPRSRAWRRAGWRRTLGEPGRLRPRRVDRRPSRCLFAHGPELEPPAAESRGDVGLRVRRLSRRARREHAPCGRAAHRPRDGPLAIVLDSGGRHRRRRRLRPLSARRAPRRAFDRERPGTLPRRRRRPRHGARGLSRTARRRRCPLLAGVVVRARRRRLRRPVALSGEGRGLRLDARPADRRGLVDRRGRRREGGARTVDGGGRRRRAQRAARVEGGAGCRARSGRRRRRRTRRRRGAARRRDHRRDPPLRGRLFLRIGDDPGRRPRGRDDGREPARHRSHAPELAPQAECRRRRVVADRRGCAGDRRFHPGENRALKNPTVRARLRGVRRCRTEAPTRNRSRISAGSGPAGRAFRERSA
ncbi:MAG: glycogen debranching protein GlgX [Betaproteobacteria bacterium]|nr:glycogen debranching protein GlgX [Betaproteobacteria bacterium]